jgi:VWFA-related protein
MPLAALLLFLALSPQDPIEEVRVRTGAYTPPEAAISVQTSLVELAVTVRNRKGEAVGGFKAADFELLDNGAPQRITFFHEQQAALPVLPPSVLPTSGRSPNAPPPANDAAPSAPQTPAPRSIALFFDDTHAGVLIGRSKVAAEKLIGNLAPGDVLAIFTSSATVSVNFTNDKKTLLDALARISPHPLDGARGFNSCPMLTPYQAYVIDQHIDLEAKEIALAEIIACRCIGPPIEQCRRDYDGATQDAAANVWNQLKTQSLTTLDTLSQVVRVLSRAPNSRVLIMISPGFVTGGMEKPINAIIDSALREHIAISGLDTEGLLGSAVESPESLGQMRGWRSEWAGRTLGQRQQIVTEFMSTVAAATGGRFFANNNDLTGGLRTLASAPEVSYLLAFSPGQPDEKYHKLLVKLNGQKNDQLQFRPGYFSTTAKETAQQRIDRKVLSNESSEEIPATVHLTQTGGKLDVEIVVDANRVPFGEQAGRHVQELTFVTVVRDKGGKYVNGAETVMDLTLTPATFAEMQAKGIKSDVSFSLPRGSYQVREVVREAVHNYFAAVDTPVEVR